MKSIDTYIVEKFKIDKDIKVDSTVDEKYNIGDICLKINYVYPNGYAYFESIKIDSIDISSKKITTILLPYLNHNSEGKKESCRFKTVKGYLHLLYRDLGSNSYNILIPHEESIDFIKELLKDEKRRIDITKYTDDINVKVAGLHIGYNDKNTIEEEKLEKYLKKLYARFK